MNTLESEYCFYVKRDSSEWHRMWKKLARHKLNRSLSEPTVADNDGEIWQYMSTWETTSGLLPGKRFEHHFRHRAHPRCGRKYITVPASRGFNPDDADNIGYRHLG
ncbi:hypothetical protein [Pantoea ananatis]|uniref:hypothetical protein n=1 Tax=Pantoea ananas TaxID=553 RepID=UPI000CF56A42|nr:hypothetical protein [Pantoea ananatis]PQK76465.1 hypothetical protein CG427_06870 [Pantoea ananatis]